MGRRTLREAKEGRIRQLLRHRLAEREERLLQPDEEEHEPDHDIDEADNHPARVCQAPAQDDELEEQHEADQRGYVGDRAEADGRYEVEDMHRGAPQTTMP